VPVDIHRIIESETSERSARIRELSLVDANIWLGTPLFFPLAEELPPAELEPLLQKYGAQGGLVSHWDGVRLSAQDGNQRLTASSTELPGSTYTIWTGLPTTPREQDPLPGFDTPDKRMRGVRLFPKTHHFQLSSWTLGELCTWCVEHNLPIFLWHVEIRWEDLYGLAAAFPRLHFVVETQWQKILYHIRDLFSLLKSRRNVLVEISNFIGQDHLAHLVGNIGAERLIYGSFLPVNDPLAAAGMILDADISAEEKKQIAGGNLRRLIEEVRT
jgi:hypothetical protein